MGIFATAGAAAAGGGPAYELISTNVLGSPASSVTFSSISQTYKHLQLRISAAATGYTGEGRIQFNSDTGANYRAHELAAAGSTPTSGYTGQITYIAIQNFVWRTPNAYNGSIIDILDYASAAKNTTIRSLSARNSFDDGNPYMSFSSGIWNNTSAVSSVTFYLEGSGSFSTSSRFSLYGYKG